MVDGEGDVILLDFITFHWIYHKISITIVLIVRTTCYYHFGGILSHNIAHIVVARLSTKFLAQNDLQHSNYHVAAILKIFKILMDILFFLLLTVGFS